MSDQSRAALVKAIAEELAQYHSHRFAGGICTFIAERIVAAYWPEPGASREVVTEAKVLAFCAGAEWANGGPFPVPGAVRVEAQSRYASQPPAPSAETRVGLWEEHYWCGCVRESRWTRCERHTDFDHDDEPPTGETAVRAEVNREQK